MLEKAHPSAWARFGVVLRDSRTAANQSLEYTAGNLLLTPKRLAEMESGTRTPLDRRYWPMLPIVIPDLDVCDLEDALYPSRVGTGEGRSSFDHTDYKIVGATENPENDIRRLRPIVQMEGSGYWLVYEDDGLEVLVEEDERFIRDEMKAGNFLEIEPIPMKPDHWLMHLGEGTLEYIAAGDVPGRLDKIAEDSILEAAHALSVGNLEKAREQIGRASMARPDDPFIVIARIALWREGVSESQMRWEMQALEDFTPALVQGRFLEIVNRTDWKPILNRIRQDPLSRTFDLLEQVTFRKPCNMRRCKRPDCEIVTTVLAYKGELR